MTALRELAIVQRLSVVFFFFPDEVSTSDVIQRFVLTPNPFIDRRLR